MDILVRDVSIIDGSGAPAFLGSIGIERGKQIVFEHDPEAVATVEIDGRGLAALPGFVDAHSHGDLNMASPYATLSKISQGITTQVAGQCGVSMFPAAAENMQKFVSGIAPYPDMPEDISACASYGTFSDWMESLHNPVTTKCFTGLGALRLWAMGYANRRPDSAELQRMQNMLRRCIREGALGLSTGLVYAPCCYADNDEILALLRIVHEEGAIYATHPRNEADTVVEARKESIRLAKIANVPLCISHLKAAGRQNWGKPAIMLRQADEAANDGVDILIDCYPYMAGNTSLNVSIPPRYFEDGLTGLVRALSSKTEREKIREEMSRPSNYENYIRNSGGFTGTYVSACPKFHDAEGMFISEYAEKVGMDPFDAYCDILIQNDGLGLGVYFHMSEEDVVSIFRHPLTVVGTDALLGRETENPHPRSFGSMPRAYHLLTDENKICSPEQAIRKMSGLAAEKLHLTGKGFLRTGYDGDVLLCDLAAFRDTATYQRGSGLTQGLNTVIANGKIVYSEGKLL